MANVPAITAPIITPTSPMIAAKIVESRPFVDDIWPVGEVVGVGEDRGEMKEVVYA